MNTYTLRLYDGSSDIVYDCVFANSLEEANIKARQQYPDYYTFEIIGYVAHKSRDDSICDNTMREVGQG